MLFLKKRKKERELESENQKRDDRRFAAELEVASDQLQGVIEQMSLTAESLQDVSSSSKKSTLQLLEHIDHTAAHTENVSDKMRKIEEAAMKITSSSQEIHSSSVLFFEELAQSQTQLKNIQENSQAVLEGHLQLLEQMNRLVTFSKQMNQILSTIGAISQKTKILALNANIESARAGIHGKSFAVVANEIGHLANQTSAAVDETHNILSSIQTEIDLSTTMVKSESDQIQKSSEELLCLIDTLHTYQDKLSEITSMVSHSREAVEIQSENVQEIRKLLEQIANMAAENKTHALTVQEDMDKQHQNIEEMLEISKALDKTAKELQKMIHKDQRRPIIEMDLEAMEEMKQKIFTLLEEAPLHQLDESVHKNVLDKFLQQNERIEAVWSNRLDGTFIYSNPPAGLINAKARKWFKEASQNKVFFSDIYTSAVTKRPCITISLPILNSGQMVGIIGVDLAML